MSEKQEILDILREEDKTIDYNIGNKTKMEFTSKTHYLIFQNIYVDILCYCLITIVILGSAYLTLNVDEQTREIRIINPTYKIPSWSDLLPSLYFLIPSYLLNLVFRRLVIKWAERNLDTVYTQDNDQDIIKSYSKKVCSNIFKFFFYLFNTVVGYYVLKDLPFMPKMLLGGGSFDVLFKPGYPQLLYWDKPHLFDIYYNLNITFSIFDLIILLTNSLQSDFLIMILHHFASISLQIFSYLYGYSNVGCIICFLHYYGDIYSYIVRTFIYLKGQEKNVFYSTVVFLLMFFYTRIIVFPSIIYDILVGLTHEWNFIEYSMVTFLCFLLCLHVLWTTLITKKLVKYCMTGQIEEIYKVKINKKHI